MRQLYCLALSAAAFAMVSFGQQAPPTGFHAVACLKVKPGKDAEFKRWALESNHKVQQANLESSRISQWMLASAVMPQGTSAVCDYVSISVFPGLPPAPQSTEELGVALKKASLTMSAQEYIDKRSSLVELVTYEMWQTRLLVGAMHKGDYLFVNRMKVQKVDDWISNEKKVWQPMAEQWIKDGSLAGWILVLPVLPGGTGLKYQAMTVDVFPNWQAAMKYPDNVPETFKKAHPGKDFDHALEYLTMRDLAVQELWKVEDLVAAQ